MQFPALSAEKWVDFPGNPLFGAMEAAIGDPQILTPGQLDSKWHMLCHGYYPGKEGSYYHHLVSDDGFDWKILEYERWDINPLGLLKDGDLFVLYYTANLFYDKAEMKKYSAANIIRAKTSTDLTHWSEGADILLPTFGWEKECDVTTPEFVQLRNPCPIKLPNGKYRLYYSGGTVKLHDCGYEEPKYIGAAESDSPLGPFVKLGEPLLRPDRSNPYRNYGAGAIKVFGWGDKFLAFENSIYYDDALHTHSAINILASDDGVVWEDAPYNPIIAPSGSGWKSTLVYQLDVIQLPDELRIYYNARNGWRTGEENIGCSTVKGNFGIRKLW